MGTPFLGKQSEIFEYSRNDLQVQRCNCCSVSCTASRKVLNICLLCVRFVLPCDFTSVGFGTKNFSFHVYHRTAFVTCRVCSVLIGISCAQFHNFDNSCVCIRCRYGRSIAEAVSRWLPTAAARVRARVWSTVDKVALRQVFSEYFGFPCHLHSTKFSIIIITRGRYNRPFSGRRAEWTQSGLHPPLCEIKIRCRFFGVNTDISLKYPVQFVLHFR
jgi:hypothetical protein